MFGRHIEELINWSGYERLKRTGTVTDEDLRFFPFEPIVSFLREVGRWAAPIDGLEAFAWTARTIRRAAEASPPRDRRVYDLIHDFCRIIASIRDKLTYDTYVCVDILLSTPSLDPPSVDAFAHCRLGQAHKLLEDLLEFETRTLAGHKNLSTCRIPATQLLANRRQHLENLLNRIGAAQDHFCSAAVEKPFDHRLWLASSLLPQTTVHDEVAFIRTLQVFECECDAVLPLLEDSIDLLLTQETDEAAAKLNSLNVIAGLFGQTTGILGTLTPSSFLSFRDVTDGSSAIQSQKIKQVEVVIGKPGQEREKSPAFRHLPEVRRRCDSLRTSLSEAAYRLKMNGLLGDNVKVELEALEQCIGDWRRVHYGLARKMFGNSPVTGTGGTEGLAYLKHWQDATLFPWLEKEGLVV